MRRETVPVNYTIYIIGFATVLCGIIALNSALTDPTFAGIASLIILLGYIVSILLRQLGYTARLIELAAIAGALLVYGQIIGGRMISEVIIPTAALESPELRLASMLLWLEVLRSFTLVSDDAVIFSAVPSIVLISLAATNNVNPDLVAIFVIYLVLTSMLLAYRSGTGKFPIKAGLKVALTVAALALAVGMAIMIPVRQICTVLFSSAMPEFSRIRQHMGGYGDGNSMPIAQGPVHLSEEVVMTVRSHSLMTGQTVPAYWRGRVYDYYSGHGWRTSITNTLAKPNSSSEDQRYLYQYGSTEAVIEAAYSGLNPLVACVEDMISSLIERLQEKNINYDIIDLTKKRKGYDA